MAATKKSAPRARRAVASAAELDEVFASLKGLLAKHAYHLTVVHDLPDNYYLETRKPGPNGRPMFFGAVQRRKNYVAYHLMPLATDPALAAAISPTLRKRMQGKSCLNFSAPDPAAFAELDRLTRAGLASFQKSKLA
jgi:hypothetical protein